MKTVMSALLGVSTLLSSACIHWSVDPFTLEGMNKVYVPYFKNDTFFRNVEQDLTRRVILRIQQRPDLFLTEEKSAEMIIEGRIIDYQKIVLAEDALDLVTAAAVRISVNVDVLRASDGEVLKSRVLTSTTDYNQRLGEVPEIAEGKNLDILARRIVALLEKEIE